MLNNVLSSHLLAPANVFFFNTEIALNASVLALEGVSNPGPVNWGRRLPEHHATSPDTSRPETEDALGTFEQSPNAEWVFSCSV